MTLLGMKTKNSKPLSPEEFVRAWQHAKTFKDLSHLGKPANLTMRAVILRRTGVPVQKFPRRGPKYDYKALAALAKKEAR